MCGTSNDDTPYYSLEELMRPQKADKQSNTQRVEKTFEASSEHMKKKLSLTKQINESLQNQLSQVSRSQEDAKQQLLEQQKMITGL